MNIPSIIQRLDRIVEDLSHPEVTARQIASGEAQYALCARLSTDKTDLVLKAAAKRLEVKVNGHVVLVESDPYTRERLVDCFRLAAEGGRSIAPYLNMLSLIRDNDPHKDEQGMWVRERATDAINAQNRLFGLPSDPITKPRCMTTRPQPPHSHGRPKAFALSSSE